MRGIRELGLVAGVLTLALLPASAGTASAGAPASDADEPDLALVLAGGTGHATAVRAGQPDSDRLWRLVQPMYSGT